MNDRQAVEFLKELLSIYSPSGQEAPLAQFLAEKLSSFGFAVEMDEVGNVVAEWQEAIPHSPFPIPHSPFPIPHSPFPIPHSPSPIRHSPFPIHHASPTTLTPPLLFLGHIDTVPGFIPVREEDGKLYGRGAVDAKGPLAAFIAAVVRAMPRLKGTGIVVVGAVGEEAEGEGARHIVNRFRPAMAIVGEPSEWDGITLGYKGRLVVHYRLSTPVTHTASPEPSAPEKALEFWWRLSSYARRVNRSKSRRFDCLDVSLRRINSSSDGFHDHVEMTIGVRTPPGVDVAQLRERIASWAGDTALHFTGGEPAYVAGRNTPLVRAFLRAIRAEGGKPRFKLKTGTSDMNVVGPVWNCPIVAYGPGDSSLDHTPDEHIEIEEYLKAIKVLERVCEWVRCG